MSVRLLRIKKGREKREKNGTANLSVEFISESAQGGIVR